MVPWVQHLSGLQWRSMEGCISTATVARLREDRTAVFVPAVRRWAIMRPEEIMPKAPQLWKGWPACQTCNGAGVEYGETCIGCGGSGRDTDCCSKCEERGIGFNDDGVFLCEDCLFEEQVGAAR